MPPAWPFEEGVTPICSLLIFRRHCGYMSLFKVVKNSACFWHVQICQLIRRVTPTLLALPPSILAVGRPIPMLMKFVIIDKPAIQESFITECAVYSLQALEYIHTPQADAAWFGVDVTILLKVATLDVVAEGKITVETKWIIIAENVLPE